ncbi:hypothetical protein M885DRAFT_532695 [Pelagophyceae sp. CCMP2097]|nr:hypothetical protein M885DRAFT_532695 [Pelagophyceae sp. CCMP2097]
MIRRRSLRAWLLVCGGAASIAASIAALSGLFAGGSALGQPAAETRHQLAALLADQSLAFAGDEPPRVDVLSIVNETFAQPTRAQKAPRSARAQKAPRPPQRPSHARGDPPPPPPPPPPIVVRVAPTPAPSSDGLSADRGWCAETHRTKRVAVGTSWGALDKPGQREWLARACDRYFCEPDGRAGRGSYKCKPLTAERTGAVRRRR